MGGKWVMGKWTSGLGFKQDLTQLGDKSSSTTRNEGQETFQDFIHEQERVSTFSSGKDLPTRFLRAGAGQLEVGQARL